MPVQTFRPDARAEILYREAQVEKHLREQQKPPLQLAAANSRLIVAGGAGTGKTLIAMEIARWVSESGRRVALLCFNQLVGEWMRNPLILTECPWCRAEIGQYDGKRPTGFSGNGWNVARTRGITDIDSEGPLLHCTDGKCSFGHENPKQWLPIEVIDERIYRYQ